MMTTMITSRTKPLRTRNHEKEIGRQIVKAPQTTSTHGQVHDSERV